MKFYKSIIQTEYLRLFKDEIKTQALLLVNTQKELNGLKEQILKQTNPKADYYNNKYPKENMSYVRTDMGKNIQIDVRTFIQKSYLFPKLIGPDDQIAYDAFMYVFNNIKYTPDKTQFGLAEYWEFPYQTLANKKGDCEDGALLMASIILSNGVPSWKVRISVGWVKEPNGSRVGHAYLTYYSETEDKWIVLDWCFLPNFNTFKDRVDYKEESMYTDVWFSFNNEYAWTTGLNTKAKQLLNIKSTKISK